MLKRDQRQVIETTGEMILVFFYGQCEKLSYFGEWKPDVLRNTDMTKCKLKGLFIFKGKFKFCLELDCLQM